MRVSQSRNESRPQKNNAIINVKTKTAIAVCVVSCLVGQTTLRISIRAPTEEVVEMKEGQKRRSERKLVLQSQQRNALFQGLLYLVFEIGIGVNDVPA